MPPRPKPTPARKRQRAKTVDTGLRPNGTIYGQAYWEARPGEYMWSPIALRDSKLGLADGEIVCFSSLMLFGGGLDDCYPSQEKIGSKINRSAKSTCRYLIGLQTKGFIEPQHRHHPDTGLQTSNRYFPIWHQSWEREYRAKHNGRPSGFQIGERFEWSLFRRERFSSTLLPLEIARDASAHATLYYGDLLLKQTPSRWILSSTNSKLAASTQIASRLERDDSRRGRHDSGGKRERKPEKTGDRRPFQHYPGRRVSALHRELKRWVRVEPHSDLSGRRSANLTSLLKSQNDTRRCPKKWPKR